MTQLEKCTTAICMSGKFETGEGTCSFICIDQLGDARIRPCQHRHEVHNKLARFILLALSGEIIP